MSPRESGTTPEVPALQDEIRQLKREHDVLICAHLYQDLAVQDVADITGDSLKLSTVARDNPQDVIIFAAVKFMAETASILNPAKHVLLPDPSATCPMAAFGPAATVREFKAKYPGAPVALYVNSVARAKAEADVVCTSSNAVKVVSRLQQETGAERVLFGPDANLARYVREQTGIDVVYLPPEGHCFVHKKFAPEHVAARRAEYPDGHLVVHPECDKAVTDAASFVGSTAQLMRHIATAEPAGQTFIIGTEVNFVRRAARDFPQHTIVPLVESYCTPMGKTSLTKIAKVLRNLDDLAPWEVKVPPDVRERAQAAIERMLEYSK